jgi:hypothetical protein
MEKKFSTEKFLEPTEKFVKAFSDCYHGDIKPLYNVDRIYQGQTYGDIKDNEKELSTFMISYEEYNEFYESEITIEELYELFKDYPKEDFNVLVKYIGNQFIIEKHSKLKENEV